MRLSSRVIAGSYLALAAVLGLASMPGEVQAQRGGPACVMENGQRVCRLGAGARARNASLRRIKFGPFTRTVRPSCRPGTRADGRWYLVACGSGRICKARCTPLRR